MLLKYRATLELDEAAEVERVTAGGCINSTRRRRRRVSKRCREATVRRTLWLQAVIGR